MRMPLPDVIQEHHPLNLLRVEGLAVVVLGLLYLTTPRKAGLKQFRASWALPAVWLVLAVLRVRHAPLFAMAAGVTLADLIAHTPAKAWLSAHGLWQDPARQKPSVEEPDHGTGQAVEDTQPTKRSTCRGWIVVTAFVGLAMVCQGSGLKLPLLGRGWAQAEQAGWPIALTDELQELKAETNRPLRIFNQLHYGGLIIFHSPESRVFIDDRCELYGFEFLADYARAEVSAPERLQAWDAEYDFDVALVMVGSPFDRFLSGEPSWKLVATDGAAALYTAGD